MKKRNKFLKSMRLGFFWPTGCLHITSKAIADAAPDWLDIHHIQRLARVVEEVGFDYTFALDFLAPFGPESTRVKHMDPPSGAYYGCSGHLFRDRTPRGYNHNPYDDVSSSYHCSPRGGS